ncbi:MAG: hypothetical protein ACP6IS_02640 [Candidatus Asgardarchaeia archaeon]
MEKETTSNTLKFFWQAFLIGFIIRAIPEVLAYPWPVGWDTIVYIAHTKLIRTNLNYYFYFFAYTKRVPILFVIFESFLALSQVDLFLAWKIIPAILYGFLGIAIFYFFNKRYSLNTAKSIVGTIFVLLAVPSLRITWDLHKNTLANAFLILGLTYLDSENKRKRFISYFFILLAFLTHQLVSAQIVLILSIYLATILLFRRYKERKNEILEKVVLIGLGISIVSFYMGYYPPRNDFTISLTSQPPPSLVDADLLLLSVLTLFLTYFFLYIPYFYQKKDTIGYIWTLSSLIPGLSPILMVISLSYWYRWLLQAIFPMAILTWATVIKEINKEEISIKSLIVKIIRTKKTVRSLFLLTLFLGITYEILPPSSPFPLYANPLTVQYVPTSMLQNTMPINENQNMVKVLQWVNRHVPPGSLIITIHPFYPWALIFLDNNTYHIRNVEFNITLATQLASSFKSGAVFLIATRRGCYYYSIFVPFKHYQEVYNVGEISVYRFIEN